MNKDELKAKICKTVNNIENIKILDYLYQFIRTAVTMWK